MLKLLCMTVLALSHLKLCYSATLTEAESVYSSIFTNYTKDIRPGTDQSAVLSVNITFSLGAINSFDEVGGIISLPGMFTLQWIDERLMWDPTTNGNLGYLSIPQTLVWLPKIYLITPAKYFKLLGDDDYTLKVLYTGQIIWMTGSVIQSTCSPDTTYFPFDQQNCTISVTPFGFGSDEVIFSATAVVDMTFFQTNGEWELVSATGSDGATPGVPSMALGQFDIVLKRRPLYFVISILLPVIFLAVLNPLVFVLPVDSGERLSFCLTVLLSFAVFMTLVDDVMPKSSEPAMALVSYYILGTIIISSLTTIVNVFILAAYHKPEGDDVPKFLQCLVRMCCCKKKNVINSEISASNNTTKYINVATVNGNIKDTDRLKAIDSESSCGEVIISWKMVAIWIDWVLLIGCYLFIMASSIWFLVKLISGS